MIIGISVSVVAGLGYVIGVVGPPTKDFGRIGPITFPLSPVMLAVYGLVMAGCALGIFTVLVAVAVNYVDSEKSR